VEVKLHDFLLLAVYEFHAAVDFLSGKISQSLHAVEEAV
jgi:hypothetical protein